MMVNVPVYQITVDVSCPCFQMTSCYDVLLDPCYTKTFSDEVSSQDEQHIEHIYCTIFLLDIITGLNSKFNKSERYL